MILMRCIAMAFTPNGCPLSEDSADVDLQQRTVELLQLARDQDENGRKFS